MSAFNLGDYVDVPTRLATALAKWPDLRIQESRPVIVIANDQQYVEISCTVWRDATDMLPVVAYCWEPIPGRTPYTKGSEMMNASTSCLGRALGFLGMGIGKSIASRNEIEARQPAHLAPVVPMRADLEQPFDTDGQSPYASAKQLGLLRLLASKQGIDNDMLKEFCTNIVGRPVVSSKELTKSEVSKVIDALKLTEPAQN